MDIYAISRSVNKKLLPKLYWVLLIFSASLITQPTLQAQDLCAQFGSTPATKPPINNGNSSSFGTGFTNEVLDISGTFTVSGAFKFERCTLRMAPGALINVTTTQDFDVLNCQIFCCGQMWQGIKMPNQGWLKPWRMPQRRWTSPTPNGA